MTGWITHLRNGVGLFSILHLTAALVFTIRGPAFLLATSSIQTDEAIDLIPDLRSDT